MYFLYFFYHLKTGKPFSFGFIYIDANTIFYRVKEALALFLVLI